MVPMLRCSLLREFTSYARAVRHSAGVVWRQPAALDVLRIGKGEGGDGQVEVGIHGVERSGTMDPMFQVARRAQRRRAHATPRAAGRDRPSRRSRARKPITRGRILRRNDAIRAATRQTRVRGRTGTHPWYTGAAARATVVASLRREEDILPVSGRSRQAMARHHELPTAVLARRW